jgi:hypothetical protein
MGVVVVVVVPIKRRKREALSFHDTTFHWYS